MDNGTCTLIASMQWTKGHDGAGPGHWAARVDSASIRVDKRRPSFVGSDISHGARCMRCKHCTHPLFKREREREPLLLLLLLARGWRRLSIVIGVLKNMINQGRRLSRSPARCPGNAGRHGDV
jgi:hypothetical protein